MSTSKTYQQSLADASSETRSPMLEKGSYIPWASPKLQTAKDLQGAIEKLVNVSRAKKLEKSHDPLALVTHTGSSSRNTSSYYVTHPTSVVDYEDEYQQDDVYTNFEDPLASAMLNQTFIQGDRVNIQSRNSGNAGRNNKRAYVPEEIVEGSNAPNQKCSKDSSNLVFRKHFNCSMLQLQWKRTLC
ncbi:hypothetical protein Tco_1390768 [Tanacetum coccineum]